MCQLEPRCEVTMADRRSSRSGSPQFLGQARGVGTSTSESVADLRCRQLLGPPGQRDDLRYRAIVFENFDLLTRLHATQYVRSVVAEISCGNGAEYVVHREIRISRCDGATQSAHRLGLRRPWHLVGTDQAGEGGSSTSRTMGRRGAR